MTDLLLLGAITRDQIRLPGLRWSLPGGAPWHAGLALTDARTGVAVVGQAGPWAAAFAMPALRAAGVEWSGPATAADTHFINDYQDDRRRQTLLDRAAPIQVDDLPRTLSPAVAISPLYRDAVADGVLRRAFEWAGAGGQSGSVVGVDVQGLLRVRGDRGRVTTRSIDLAARLRGASAIKLSIRELSVVAPGREAGAAASALAAAAGAEVLVTSGASGALVALPSGAVHEHTNAALDGAEPQDTTGAGDVFLGAYLLARSRRQSPAGSLEAGVGAAGELIRRRGSAARRRAWVARIRHQQALAAWVMRRVSGDAARAHVARELWTADGPLASALTPHFQGPLFAPDEADAGARGAALTGACWALLTRGWPDDDPALSVQAFQAAVEAEAEACSRVRRALLA